MPRARPWKVDDAPSDYLEGMLRAIVGLEFRIERLEGKFKLSQNRDEQDRDGVLRGLAGSALGGRSLIVRGTHGGRA